MKCNFAEAPNKLNRKMTIWHIPNRVNQMESASTPWLDAVWNKSQPLLTSSVYQWVPIDGAGAEPGPNSVSFWHGPDIADPTSLANSEHILYCAWLLQGSSTIISSANAQNPGQHIFWGGCEARTFTFTLCFFPPEINYDWQQWILVNILMHTPHFQQSCIFQCPVLKWTGVRTLFPIRWQDIQSGFCWQQTCTGFARFSGPQRCQHVRRGRERWGRWKLGLCV